MTRNDDKDLGTEPRSHAKYEARWQELWAEDHWLPAPCLPAGDTPVVLCLLNQSIAETRRRKAAWDKIEQDEAASGKPANPTIPLAEGSGHQAMSGGIVH